MKSLDMRTFFLLNFLIPKPVGILAATLDRNVFEKNFLPFLLNVVFQPAAVGVRGDLLQHLHLLLAMLLQLLQVKLAVLPEFRLTLFCLFIKTNREE